MYGSPVHARLVLVSEFQLFFSGGQQAFIKLSTYGTHCLLWASTLFSGGVSSSSLIFVNNVESGSWRCGVRVWGEEERGWWWWWWWCGRDVTEMSLSILHEHASNSGDRRSVEEKITIFPNLRGLTQGRDCQVQGARKRSVQISKCGRRDDLRIRVHFHVETRTFVQKPLLTDA